MIWKCASGGYHSGRDCYDEYGQFMTHTGAKHDVLMVRIPDHDELMDELRGRYGQRFAHEDVDAILDTLVALTPDGKDKKAWERLHRRK